MKNATHGKIEKIIEEIPAYVVMYLINKEWPRDSQADRQAIDADIEEAAGQQTRTAAADQRRGSRYNASGCLT